MPEDNPEIGQKAKTQFLPEMQEKKLSAEHLAARPAYLQAAWDVFHGAPGHSKAIQEFIKKHYNTPVHSFEVIGSALEEIAQTEEQLKNKGEAEWKKKGIEQALEPWQKKLSTDEYAKKQEELKKKLGYPFFSFEELLVHRELNQKHMMMGQMGVQEGLKKGLAFSDFTDQLTGKKLKAAIAAEGQQKFSLKSEMAAKVALYTSVNWSISRQMIQGNLTTLDAYYGRKEQLQKSIPGVQFNTSAETFIEGRVASLTEEMFAALTNAASRPAFPADDAPDTEWAAFQKNMEAYFKEMTRNTEAVLKALNELTPAAHQIYVGMLSNALYASYLYSYQTSQKNPKQGPEVSKGQVALRQQILKELNDYLETRGSQNLQYLALLTVPEGGAKYDKQVKAMTVPGEPKLVEEQHKKTNETINKQIDGIRGQYSDYFNAVMGTTGADGLFPLVPTDPKQWAEAIWNSSFRPTILSFFELLILFRGGVQDVMSLGPLLRNIPLAGQALTPLTKTASEYRQKHMKVFAEALGLPPEFEFSNPAHWTRLQNATAAADPVWFAARQAYEKNAMSVMGIIAKNRKPVMDSVQVCRDDWTMYDSIRDKINRDPGALAGVDPDPEILAQDSITPTQLQTIPSLALSNTPGTKARLKAAAIVLVMQMQRNWGAHVQQMANVSTAVLHNVDVHAKLGAEAKKKQAELGEEPLSSINWLNLGVALGLGAGFVAYAVHVWRNPQLYRSSFYCGLPIMIGSGAPHPTTASSPHVTAGSGSGGAGGGEGGPNTPHNASGTAGTVAEQAPKAKASAAASAETQVKAKAAPLTTSRVIGGVVRTGLTALAIYGAVEEVKKAAAATERVAFLKEFREQTESDIKLLRARLEAAGFQNAGEDVWRLGGGGPGFDFGAIFRGMDGLSNEEIAHMRFVQISSGVMAGLALLSIVSGPAGFISLAAFPGLLLHSNLQEADQWAQRRQLLAGLFGILHGGTPQQNALVASIFHLIPVESGAGKSLVELYQNPDAGHWAHGPTAGQKKATEEFAKKHGGALPLTDGSGASFNLEAQMGQEIAGGLLVLRAVQALAPVEPSVCTFPPLEILSRGPTLLAQEIPGYAGSSPAEIQEGANRAATKLMRGIMLMQYALLRHQAAQQAEKGSPPSPLLQARLDVLGAQYAGGGWTMYDLVQRTPAMQKASPLTLDEALTHVTSEVLQRFSDIGTRIAIGHMLLLAHGASVMHRGGRQVYVAQSGSQTAFFTCMENGGWFWSTPGHPQWLPVSQGGFSQGHPLNGLASALANIGSPLETFEEGQHFKMLNDQAHFKGIMGPPVFAGQATQDQWHKNNKGTVEFLIEKKKKAQEAFLKNPGMSAGASAGHNQILAFRDKLLKSHDMGPPDPDAPPFNFTVQTITNAAAAQGEFASVLKTASSVLPATVPDESPAELMGFVPESPVVEIISVGDETYTFGNYLGLWWERTGDVWHLVHAGPAAGPASEIGTIREMLAKLNGGFSRKGTAQFEALSGANLLKQAIDATAAGTGVPNQNLQKLVFDEVDSQTAPALVFPGVPLQGQTLAPALQPALQQLLKTRPSSIPASAITSVEVRYGQLSVQGVPHEVLRVSFLYTMNGVLHRFDTVAARRVGDTHWLYAQTNPKQLTEQGAEALAHLTKAVTAARQLPGIPQLLERSPLGTSVVVSVADATLILHFHVSGQVTVQCLSALPGGAPGSSPPSAAEIAQQLQKISPAPLSSNGPSAIPLDVFARAMALAIPGNGPADYWQVAGVLTVIANERGGSSAAEQLQLWVEVNQIMQKLHKEHGDVPQSLLLEQLQKLANSQAQ